MMVVVKKILKIYNKCDLGWCRKNSLTVLGLIKNCLGLFTKITLG
jgi:hypothetical protein